MSSVLLIGEQVTAAGVQIKGFDYFGVYEYKEEGKYLVQALTQQNHQVDWMRSHQVSQDLPEDIEAYKTYDVILMSDIGSNSILFHPEMLAQSVPHPNRLELLRQYVEEGGGLAMIGGWMSFAGIDGRARYHNTPLEQALPVTCLPYDDRMEKPESVVPKIVEPKHPICTSIEEPMPYLLGYNQVTPKENATTILSVGSDPLLCVWEYGAGRSAAFTSDCAPHWCPPVFLNWDAYPVLWNNIVRWLAKE